MYLPPIKAWVFPLAKFVTTSHLTVLFHLDAFDPVLAFLHREILQLMWIKMGPHLLTAKAASADCNHRITQRQVLAACRLFGGWWYQDAANMVKVPFQNEISAFELLGQLFAIPMRDLSLLEKMRIGDIFPQTLKVKFAAWLRNYLIWRAEWA